MSLEIAVDDPRAHDVGFLLAAHLAFSRGVTPVEYSYALDVDELSDPRVTFFSAREDGWVVGVAALKRLDSSHAELKSMHTRESERSRGIGRAMVEHLVLFCRTEGYCRLSLETGSTEEFASARALYLRLGFQPCEPFGTYTPSAYNFFMTMDLDSPFTSGLAIETRGV